MKNAGITLIELLLVVSLIAILGASSTPFLSNFLVRVNMNTTTDQVVSYLQKAQSYAIYNKVNETWGVCITGNNLRFFSGSCAVPTYSEEYVIPSSISISNFDTTFSKSRGEPSVETTINVSSDIDSQTIIINTAGGMNIN